MPPRFIPVAAPRCPRCNKMVYQAEQVIGPNSVHYHKACYTCLECNKRLDSASLAEHNGQAYCKTCHTKKWGPTGYGYAGGAAFLQPEEPGNEFKKSLQRVSATHTGSSIHSNHSATSDGASSPARTRITPSSPTPVSDDNTEEQGRQTPVNATLKKRSSLDMIREQAEASRRAYDEAYALRAAAHKQQQQQRHDTLTPTSSGTTIPRHSTGNDSSSNLSIEGSDTSSVFGSTVANAGSPTPSFSSLTSTTSAQSTASTPATSVGAGGTLATKTIYFNQPYRSGRISSNSSNASTSAQSTLPQKTTENETKDEDPVSELTKSYQVLNFQTGASSDAQLPRLPVRSVGSKQATPPASTTPTHNSGDESYLDYVPIRLVAKADDKGVHSAGKTSARQTEDQQQQQQQDGHDENEDNSWEPEDIKEEKRKQAVLQQFYDNKADKSYAIQQQSQHSANARAPTSTPKAPVSSTAKTVSQLVNEAKQLTAAGRRYQAAVPEPAPVAPFPAVQVNIQPIQQNPAPKTEGLQQQQQQQKQQQPATIKKSTSTGPVDDDEWDEDPTPHTYESKDSEVSYVGRWT
ncbi:hypothetical protein BGW42_003434 [Actinomortierella wolfii]|nr:hypothetical protein BGW42_003434 [Actinomortierella wolfii]